MPAGKAAEEAGTDLSGFERNAAWWIGDLIEVAGICRDLLNQKAVGDKTQVKVILLLAKIYEDQRNPTKARATLEHGLSYQPGNDEIKARLVALGKSVPPAGTPSH